MVMVKAPAMCLPCGAGIWESHVVSLRNIV
jgi:hypothetical protein